ncbi:spondin-2-like isoform X2 [Pectinophora gossypiella]|uniref:spondin-2-like isoform X2 n=1 Tax=Pectinophora gossypiella TaxID=13191 RepID=UPI00214E782A|nr:spondin-2-like isoform X2 [Pectinophora gossypiella]
MEVQYQLTAILIFSIAWCSLCIACEMDDVAVYKVKLQTHWNQGTSDDYPAKAQWSQVFGQSHNKTYALYRIGEVSRPLVRDFLLHGDMDDLMEDSDGEPKIYDQFIAPGIGDGTGYTEAVVFVDGGHSLVSLICRMVASHNWFVGVDSLDLCVHSSWIEDVTLDLEPLQTGVSLNEDQEDIKPVERVSHRNFARSYRHPRQNQPIAKVEFIKVKEYSTKELNDLARRELLTKIKHDDKHKTIHKQFNREYNFNEATIRNPFEQLKDLEEDAVGTPRPNNPDNNVIVVTKAPELKNSEELNPDLENMDDVVLAVANGKKLGLGKHLPRHFRSRLHHAVNKRHGMFYM